MVRTAFRMKIRFMRPALPCHTGRMTADMGSRSVLG